LRKSPISALLAASVAAVLLLGGCSSGSQGGGSGGSTDAGATLRIQTSEPAGLDPAVSVTQKSLRMTELIFDTLIDYDQNNKLIPMIAESWTTSTDGLTYVFTLRDNAKFSDGSAITPDDVVYSLQRAGASKSLTSSFAVVSSISATGDHQVTVKLSAPSRVFLNSLASVGQAVILKKSAVEGDANYFTKPTATSGPWVLKDYAAKSNATLTANPYYWNAGHPSIKTIQYTFNSDNTAMATALESGTTDLAFNMKPADGVRLQKAGAIQYFLANSAGFVSWSFDKTKPPFDDVNVRTAIAYLAPRQDRLDTCWSGIGPVSFGDLIFKGQDFFTAGDDKFNVSKADALKKADDLLTAAGWVTGSDGVRVSKGVKGIADGTRFEVKVPYESTWSQAQCNTELLQQALAPAGIKATPQAYDAATFYTDAAAGKFQFWHGGNNYATVDAYFGQTLTCKGSVNPLLVQWCNEDVDKLIAQAQATSDLDQAAKLYRQVQDIVEQQQPFVVTGAQYAVIGATTKLKGYYPRPDASNRSLIYATLGS
jgi:peptide/nickel transport system substrate-binding protein